MHVLPQGFVHAQDRLWQMECQRGPTINSLAPNFACEQPLALRWTSLEPDTMTEALPAMNRACNCLDFREALRHWTSSYAAYSTLCSRTR